jgi:hypothetical protein
MKSVVLENLKAESLLEGSQVLVRVRGMVEGLAYASAGEAVSYDDMYARLAGEVDALPRLGLELDVPPGTEGRYSIRLTMGMEQVVDGCDRVARRVGLFESRVREAAGRLKRLHGEFGAWYALAATERLYSAVNLSLSSAQVKQLADSEYARLTGDLETSMEGLLGVVRLLKAEIREHKRTQMDKYGMGKDQVNASWTSRMPSFEGGVTTDDPGRLLEEDKDEGADEGLPLSPPLPPKSGGFVKYGTPRPSTVVEEGQA